MNKKAIAWAEQFFKENHRQPTVEETWQEAEFWRYKIALETFQKGLSEQPDINQLKAWVSTVLANYEVTAAEKEALVDTSIEVSWNNRKIPSLTGDQAYWVCQRVGIWLFTLYKEGYGSPSEADATHSALLGRLLSGLEPLDKAPPKDHSYPNYQLALGKKIVVYPAPKDRTDIENKVSINQCSDWEWVDREKGVLKHTLTGDLYQYTTEMKKSAWADFTVREALTHYLQKIDENPTNPT